MKKNNVKSEAKEFSAELLELVSRYYPGVCSVVGDDTGDKVCITSQNLGSICVEFYNNDLLSIKTRCSVNKKDYGNEMTVVFGKR